MPRSLSTPRGASKKVVAVVLAAGESRRMGQINKLALPVDGVPMVARVVDSLSQSLAERVVVVTGYESDRIRAALWDRDVDFVHNPDYESGMGSSVRTGISALGADVDAAIVALGDMPWVGPEVVDRLIDAFAPGGEISIYIPIFGRKRGNPVLWGAQHFQELKELSGDVGGKAVFRRHPEAICYVDVESAGVNIDIDTPKALEGLQADDEGES